MKSQTFAEKLAALQAGAARLDAIDLACCRLEAEPLSSGEALNLAGERLATLAEAGKRRLLGGLARYREAQWAGEPAGEVFLENLRPVSNGNYRCFDAAVVAYLLRDVLARELAALRDEVPAGITREAKATALAELADERGALLKTLAAVRLELHRQGLRVNGLPAAAE